MGEYVIPFSGPSSRRWLTGSKAINLAKLAQAEFLVADGFAIAFDALDQVIEANGRATEFTRMIGRIDAAENADLSVLVKLRELIRSCDIPAEILEEINSNYQKLGDVAVSVRSSSSLEDKGSFSFAGQHDSFLNVINGGQLIERIRQVWASAYTDRAVSYLKVLKVSIGQTRMAVVVQKMVMAEVSGVAFTLHPLDGRRDRLFISANFGLGESTVGGAVTPDEIVLDKETLEVETYTPGDKTSKVIAKKEGGSQELASTLKEREARALSEDHLKELAATAKSIETLMDGNPQDIEWAYEAGRFFILQARPMVMKAAIDGAGIHKARWESPIPGAHWKRNWRLGEWIPDAVTPLFASWILPKLVAAREEFGTGALGWGDMESFSMPKPWFCIVNGYFYTRQDFPGMQGIDPPSVEDRIERMKLTRQRIKQWSEISLPAYVDYFERNHKTKDIKHSTSTELLAFVEKLVNEAGEFWSFIAPIGYGFEELMFKPLYNKLIDGEKPHYSVLFSGYPSRMIDAQAELWRIAARIRSETGLAEKLLALDVDQLDFNKPHGLPGWLLDAVKQFAEDFGHQVLSLDIHWPTLGEHPAHTLLSLKALVSASVPDPRESLVEKQLQREAAVEDILSRLKDEPQKQQQFGETIAYYQGNAAVRENSNFYFQIGWPLIRESVRELAHRLQAKAVLSDTGQIVFLEKEELYSAIKALEAGSKVPELSGMAESRQKTWQAQRQWVAPISLPVDEAEAGTSAWQADSKEMRGIGVSRGTARGKVRIVMTDEDAKTFSQGEILVIKAASPLFTPLMLLAGGLIVEVGGGASHSSLVAREIGLPAVVNASHATEIFTNGQQVELDGEKGIIRLIDG